MCLRFLCCGDHEDHGPADGQHEPRPTPPPPPHPREISDQEKDAPPVKQASPELADAGGKPKSGEAAVQQGYDESRRTNGSAHPGGGNKNGEHVAAVTDRSDTDVPSGGIFPSAAPGGQAPQTTEYVAAGAPQPKKATDKMRAAPAPQVARPAEDVR